MVVVCRTCSATYHIPDEILGDEACRFRCSRCGHSWDIQPRPTLAGSLAPFRGAAPAARTASEADFAPAPARRAASVGSPRRSLAPPRSPARWRRSPRARRSSPSRRRLAASMRRSACRSIRVGLAIVDVSARLGAGGDKSLLAVEGALVNLRGKETAAPESAHRACAPPTGANSMSGRRARPRTGSPPASAFPSSPASPRRRPASSTRWSNSSRRGDKDSLAPEG